MREPNPINKVKKLSGKKLPVNLIPADLWIVLVKKLSEGTRFHQPQITRDALRLLELAAHTRRSDVLPHVMPLVTRMRKGKAYSSGFGKPVNQRMAAKLSVVLQLLKRHARREPGGDFPAAKRLYDHIQAERKSGLAYFRTGAVTSRR